MIDICLNKTLRTAATLLAVLAAGCGETQVEQPVLEADAPAAPGTPIGRLAEVFAFEPVAVEGYGLVGGLAGTGSAQCAENVRSYLRQYILQELPDKKTNVDRLIESRNTAVVVLRGTVPAMAPRGHRFDVEVSPLEGTQTTSLANGWLYGAELRPAGAFGFGSRVIAHAGGPVFVDYILNEGRPFNPNRAFLLAGGIVLDEYKANLALLLPNYRIASDIRNRLNERFGPGTANAVSAGMVELKVPAKYKRQKHRFMSLVKATRLGRSAAEVDRDIDVLVGRLAALEDPEAAEVAIEASGNKSLGRLEALLNSPSGQVRLRAARCILNLDGDRALEALRNIALDAGSPLRIEALETIASSGDRKAASFLARRLLRDDDLSVRLAAYETLRTLEDISINRSRIARSFDLEQIVQTPHKLVFAARSGRPRIAIFGSPISCRDNIFIQSDDGMITINAPEGQGHISIIRYFPGRPEMGPVTLKSSFALDDVIRTLCEEVDVKDGPPRNPGVEVSYAQAIALLKKMCDRNAVEAAFHSGPLPKAVIVKK
jgi:hypothetical protein